MSLSGLREERKRERLAEKLPLMSFKLGNKEESEGNTSEARSIMKRMPDTPQGEEAEREEVPEEEERSQQHRLRRKRSSSSSDSESSYEPGVRFTDAGVPYVVSKGARPLVKDHAKSRGRRSFVVTLRARREQHAVVTRQ